MGDRFRDTERDMASDTRDLKRLEDKYKNQSARIRTIAKDLEYMKFENEVLKDFIMTKMAPNDDAMLGDKIDAPNTYEKEEEGSIHDPYETPQKYLGFNKFYIPEMATTKRWEDSQTFAPKVSTLQTHAVTLTSQCHEHTSQRRRFDAAVGLASTRLQDSRNNVAVIMRF